MNEEDEIRKRIFEIIEENQKLELKIASMSSLVKQARYAIQVGEIKVKSLMLKLIHLGEANERERNESSEATQ